MLFRIGIRVFDHLLPRLAQAGEILSRERLWQLVKLPSVVDGLHRAAGKLRPAAREDGTVVLLDRLARLLLALLLDVQTAVDRDAEFGIDVLVERPLREAEPDEQREGEPDEKNAHDPERDEEIAQQEESERQRGAEAEEHGLRQRARRQNERVAEDLPESLFIADAEREDPKRDHDGKRQHDVAGDLRDREPRDGADADRDHVIGKVAEILCQKEEDRAEQRRLQRIDVVLADALPEVVRDEDAFRPDHIADDVAAPRKPDRRDEPAENEGAVKEQVGREHQALRDARQIGCGGIAYAEVGTERIDRAASDDVEKPRHDEKQNGREEDDHQKVDDAKLSESAL